MSKDKFTFEENRMLTEIYRRLNYFHKGNLDESLLLLELPHRAKTLIKMGIIKVFPYESKRVYNWYNLTDKGKTFFKNYIEEVNENVNEKLFNGEIKTFDKTLLKD